MTTLEKMLEEAVAKYATEYSSKSKHRWGDSFLDHEIVQAFKAGWDARGDMEDEK